VAGARQMLASDGAGRQVLRTVGGLLLGSGMLVVFIRRSDAFPDPWGDLALLLVLLAPCVFLYATGMLGARATGVWSPWHGVFLIFGTLLVAPVLFQFLEWVGGDTGAPLNVAWIFLVTAIAGAAAAVAAGVRYTLLLASLALIVAWLALWDEILTDGVFAEVGTLRWLLVAIGAVLLLLGAGARMAGGAQEAQAPGNELLTGGGLAAVGAGAISFAALYTATVPGAVPSAQPTVFWDAYLLVVSVGAIVLAASLGVRGLAYAGAVGLAIFTLLVGLDLDDDQPAGKVLGWPLIVLVVGAVAFLASLGGTRGRPRPPGGGQL
jgi:hypothetical protein